MSLGLIKQHPIKLFVSFLVSIIFLYFAFRGLEWSQFIHSLSQINIYYIVIAGLLLIFSIWVRTLRWKILLSPQKDCKPYPLFQALYIGYFGNNVLPLRMGEVVRAVIATKFTGIPISGTGISIVVERGIDVISFLILAGIYTAFYPGFPSARLVSIIGLVVVLLSTIFIVLMSKNSERVKTRLTNWVEKKRGEGKKGIAKHTMTIYRGLETIWNMPSPWIVFGMTLFLWILYLVITMLTLQAFDFSYSSFEFFKIAATLLIFTTLSLSVPAAPGAVGTYHGAVIIALGLFSLDKANAQVFSVVMHLLNYLVMTIPGAIFLMLTGVKLSTIVQEQSDKT